MAGQAAQLIRAKGAQLHLAVLRAPRLNDRMRVPRRDRKDDLALELLDALRREDALVLPVADANVGRVAKVGRRVDAKRVDLSVSILATSATSPV